MIKDVHYHHARHIHTPGGIHTVHICRHLNDNHSNPSKIWNRYSSCYIIEGRGKYIDDNGNELNVEPGCIVQHLPGKYHHIERYQGGWEEIGFGFDKELYHQLQKLGFIQNDIGVIPKKNIIDLPNALESLRMAMTDQECSNSSLMSKFTQCLASIQNQALHNQPSNSLDRAAEQLKQDHQCKINLNEMSRALNMSYVSFRSKFKNKFGDSPASLRKKSRLSQALLKLTDNRVCIGDLAESLGYRDRFSFSKEFKKAFAISPVRYQKEQTAE